MNAFVIYGLIEPKIKKISQQIEDLGAGFDYKGSVASYSDLPASATAGDSYTVKDEGNAQYTYDGEEWVRINDDVIDEVAKVAESLAGEYDNTQTYEEGELTVHANKLYKCTSEIDTPEEWNEGHWEETTIFEELKDKVDSSRTVNGKSLTEDITLDAGDLGYDKTKAYGANTVGAKLTNLEKDKVNKTTKVNNKALSGDITLNAGDLEYDSTKTYAENTVGNEIAIIEEDIEAISNATIDSMFD